MDEMLDEFGLGCCGGASRTSSRAGRSNAPLWPACWPSHVAFWSSTSRRRCSTPRAARGAGRGASERAAGLTLVRHPGDGGGPRGDRVVAIEAGTVVFTGRPASSSPTLRWSVALAGVAACGRTRLLLRERGRVFARLPLARDELVSALGGERRRVGAAATGRRGRRATARRRLRPLFFAYDEGGRPVAALRDVSHPRCDETVALLGPTGSGKSTLLQLCAACSSRTRRGPSRRPRPARPGYGARQRTSDSSSRRPELQLFAATARRRRGVRPASARVAARRSRAAARDALAAVGLPEPSFGGRHPYSLSGGEQRRLALAGVLAMRPGLLLLDEPFVSLDPAGPARARRRPPRSPRGGRRAGAGDARRRPGLGALRRRAGAGRRRVGR